jgi:hypothetical protein
MPDEYRFTGVSRTSDLAELDDLVELGLDLAAVHAEDRAVEVDVLTAGEFRVEPVPTLQQRADAAAHDRLALRRLDDSAKHLEQRGFTAPLRPITPSTSPRATRS